MADNEEISLETIEATSRNLAELLTNSVNMVNAYYEIFFDQDPHYVALKQYDKEGNLITTMVPNRAMDRSIAFYGDTDPENEVEAYVGALYINTRTRNLFIKKVPTGKRGWTNITPQKIEVHRETHAVNSGTTQVTIEYVVPSKNALDVYVNGSHLESDDFELSTDFKTLKFLKQFPDDSTMQIVYMTGLYGLKGDTAISVTPGTIEILSPQENARIENSGTDNMVVLDFYIPRGYRGNGIESINKTSTSGLVDTYTVTCTDGVMSTFNVTNGGSVIIREWS